MSDTKCAKYEQILVDEMIVTKKSLSETILEDMEKSGIDTESVFDVVDFLEERLVDLDKVSYYMMVMTGQCPDVILVENINGQHR